jgi:hypothetical protein
MMSAGQTLFPCTTSIAGAMAGIASASSMSAGIASETLDMVAAMPATTCGSAYRCTRGKKIEWQPTAGHLKSLAFDYAAERAALRYEEALATTCRPVSMCSDGASPANETRRPPSWKPIFDVDALFRLHQLRESAGMLALASGIFFSGTNSDTPSTHRGTMARELALETTLVESALQNMTEGPEIIDAVMQMIKQSIPVLKRMPFAARKGYIVRTLLNTIISNVVGESRLHHIVADDGALRLSCPDVFHRSAKAIEEAFKIASAMEPFQHLFEPV